MLIEPYLAEISLVLYFDILPNKHAIFPPNELQQIKKGFLNDWLHNHDIFQHRELLC
jgi:hypothetical protein